MLTFLSIRDVVLIERLDLTFGPGLGVLTGETGAGKSILLDSVSLALGGRADSALVRKGADKLSVTAGFTLAPDHPARLVLAEAGLEADPGEPVMVRRVVNADGRSRAFVNDQATSASLLKTLGRSLVEVHGQFESHGLLDPNRHGPVLDAFGPATAPAVAATTEAHGAWRAAARARADAEAVLARARAEEDLLRATVEDLRALAPQPGEEEQLAEERSFLQNGEKLAEGLSGALAALSGSADVEGTLRHALRALDRVTPLAGTVLEPVVQGLDRAAVELAEARAGLESIINRLDMDPRRLETVEERLFALRGQARKHGVTVEALPDLLAEAEQGLESLDGEDARLDDLRRAEDQARTAYLAAARALSTVRRAAAAALDAAIAAELAPLKLEKARFQTRVEDQPEDQWGPRGLDRVTFLVATNPGADPGPLHKVASGGELSRFMLALKVVLAADGEVSTLVFDEVDAGIGGATAAAVGERLARLGQAVQVLVVTHSPQVAARGQTHYRVSKSQRDDGLPGTTVSVLSDEQRLEEIARMLAGAEVTGAARAAAADLLAATG
ncbi:DNA repair protein RecN [Pararhodospirillum photometricum]|uniref:DNA repair protein RecN n=1 Tax=Pararhodospirillum photometricum DSM 122 TaxID=1150469 RepID=H6SLR2_PARPM|nr:DNA repair protein RecN [Pararhodospirillum photometricum]CCG08927.1 DNA repair protein RecN [Pararhodospirillum photometricum DSM 122]